MNISKRIISYLFKTNLTAFRTALLTNNTNRLCRILDVEREYLSKELDRSGNTALLLAIQNCSPLTVHILLEQGAEPDQPNYVTFQTPLALLASTVYQIDALHEAKIALEMATILLDHGAYVDKPSPYHFTDDDGNTYVIRETPLMTAVRMKNMPMALLFLERKASVNYIEKQFNNRPVHYSIMNGDLAMFDLLEDAGALCHSVVTNENDTLLHTFCYYKTNDENIPLLQKLIEKGCDINAENIFQRTPLMLAAKLDMTKTCQALLNAAADLNRKDIQGYQAIDLTKSGSECFKLIERAIRSQQVKFHPHDGKHRALWKKQVNSVEPYSKYLSKSIHHVTEGENQVKRFASHIIYDEKLAQIDNDAGEEANTKYQRMLEKLIQTKSKKQRTRDSSLPRANHLSHMYSL